MHVLTVIDGEKLCDLPFAIGWLPTICFINISHQHFASPIWCLENFASWEASIHYTALRIKPRPSKRYKPSLGTSLA